MSVIGTIKKHKYYIAIALGFLFFLLTVPHFTSLTMVCLKHIPGQSYAYTDCTLEKAMDQFIVLSLIGLVISLMLIYVVSRRHGLKTFVIFAFIFGISTVGAYYLYIPQADKQVNGSAIYLESLWDSEKVTPSAP